MVGARGGYLRAGLPALKLAGLPKAGIHLPSFESGRTLFVFRQPSGQSRPGDNEQFL
jgi:hypothetical protein